MGKEYEHCLYTPPVTRSNEPQRISRKGKIGEVKDGELWNMLVGTDINCRSLRQNLATKLKLDKVVRLEGWRLAC